MNLPDSFTLDWRTSVVRQRGKGWVIARTDFQQDKQLSLSTQIYRNPAAAKRAFDAGMVTYLRPTLSRHDAGGLE